MEYIDTSNYFITYNPYVENTKDKIQQLDFNNARYSPTNVYSFPTNIDDQDEEDLFGNMFESSTATTSSTPTSSTTTTSSTMPSQTVSNIGKFNVSKAIEELHKNVHYQLVSGQGHITEQNENKYRRKKPKDSGHRCGVAVRLATQAGGLQGIGANSGGNMGSSLLRNGWEALPANTPPKPGDIAVTKPHGTHKDGHVSMYDGQNWVSDFIQESIFVYKSANNNNTTIYRYKGS